MQKFLHYYEIIYIESKNFFLLYYKKFITMLVSSFNLSQSFNYTPYLFYKKKVQNRDQMFLYMDPIYAILPQFSSQSNFKGKLPDIFLVIPNIRKVPIKVHKA